MTADTQETTSSDQQQEVAVKYETALAHLERLQQQLDTLRSTIPSLVGPLVRPATSKARLFATVRKSALQCTDNLNAFREQWTSEQTQTWFADSRQSVEKNGDLSKAMDVAEYGWSPQ